MPTQSHPRSQHRWWVSEPPPPPPTGGGKKGREGRPGPAGAYVDKTTLGAAPTSGAAVSKVSSLMFGTSLKTLLNLRQAAGGSP